MLRRLIAIVGPTASGKSAAAMQLATELGGEIVNGDSRQVYRGMDIGTAKPSLEDRRAIRHHGYNVVDPDEPWSLALYRKQARAAFEDIWARGSFPWLVGGTGQYVWALLEDWQVPEVAPDGALRAELTAHAAEHGPDALHARLATVDPVAAERIDARNVRRVVRAIEVFEHTGRPISEWQTHGDPDFEFLLYGLKVEPDELASRIDGRVASMFRSGFVEEVQELRAKGCARELPSMSSIGYGEVYDALEGRMSMEEAIELTKRATRRLARRQAQWFRPADARIHWVHSADSMEMESNIFTGACTNVIRGAGRG
jgi:tRNA dimethylallyltransferase